eukprot:9486704-Pyramimonas_sp.AAC.1
MLAPLGPLTARDNAPQVCGPLSRALLTANDLLDRMQKQAPASLGKLQAVSNPVPNPPAHHPIQNQPEGPRRGVEGRK